MANRLVVYVSTWCYNCSDTRDALKKWGVPAEYVDIDKDATAARQVLAWTGYRSVPTLLIAEEGSLEPYEAPALLAPGASPHGIDRGSMLTEPSPRATARLADRPRPVVWRGSDHATRLTWPEAAWLFGG